MTYAQRMNAQMAKISAHIEEPAPLKLPTVSAQFQDVYDHALQDFLNPVNEVEVYNALKFAFFAGVLHGHQENLNSETVNCQHVAEMISELSRLRTYASARKQFVVIEQPLLLERLA